MKSRNLSRFFFMFYFTTIGLSGQNRVEAEEMELTNYIVEMRDNTTYIKLTKTAGTAAFRFSLPSGRYDIEACYLSEEIGQNGYAMYLNDIQIISWLGKNRDDKWHLISEQKWHPLRKIAINTGDIIKIETLSETGSLAILDYLKFTESQKESSSTMKNEITIYPEEYEKAIKNPLKGFRGSFDKEHEYSTLVKSYIAWNEIESIASDGVNKIKNVSDKIWSGCEKKNIKFIPRVYLSYPKKKSGWPADMTEGDFTSDQFKQRVIALIRKIGKAWDNDSRVAYVEIGIVGEWGEMEFPDTRDDIKEAISAEFASSFRNKLVLVRWPNTYNDDVYNYGYYWDSWAHKDQSYYGFHLKNTSPKWKTAVVGGEVAYDWGNYLIQPGRNPDESLLKSIHRNYLIDEIRNLHGNHMGWISKYNQSNDSVRAGAAIVQKALGYRFVISEINYPKKIDAANNFTISFKVKNTGSTPLYYNWPVEVSLLDPKTRLPIWKQTCTNLDVRSWLPGDKWDSKNQTYVIAADEQTIKQTFRLIDVPAGEYVLALAILDPAGNRPSVRFAIKNYYNGGRHPMGKVGVDKNIDSFLITQFDDIQSDTSITYDRVVN
jgi:hypothetical protein